MRLLLLAPTVEPERYPRGGYAFRVANYNLPLIAALTPPYVDITIVDQCVSKIPFDTTFDLVGITVNTPLAPYSYELSAKFRSAGAKVVLGGIHPSQLPDEALCHADTVVIGEAEPVWAQLIEDFRRERLKSIYHAQQADLRTVPTPRWDLLNSKRYILSRSLTATRGCNHGCTYCSISLAVGRGLRVRPVQHVVRDIKAAKTKRLVLWDDNIAADTEYCQRLFRALIPLKVKWISQATLDFARDEDLVKLARLSGCRGIFLGLESLSVRCLDECGKSFNLVSNYRKAVNVLHSNGIGVSAGFVFGFDHDQTDCFEQTLEFVNRIGIDACNFKILTPYPGTALFKKLDREGRIIDRDWSRYRGKTHVVFQPKQMTPEQLLNGFKWVRQQCYSWKSIVTRLFGSHTSFAASLPLNLGYRYIIRKEDPDPGWNPSSKQSAVSGIDTTCSLEGDR